MQLCMLHKPLCCFGAALEDYNLDGDHEFLVADLGSGYSDMKLKAYQGTELVHQTPLLYIPTALCTFYIDSTEPRTPAIAVASGSYIYMYKNLHPYFKFTLPGLQVCVGQNIVYLNMLDRPLIRKETRVHPCKPRDTTLYQLKHITPIIIPICSTILNSEVFSKCLSST